MESEISVVRINQELVQENKRLRHRIAELQNQVATQRVYLHCERIDASKWRKAKMRHWKRQAEMAARPWWKKIWDDQFTYIVLGMLTILLMVVCMEALLI